MAKVWFVTGASSGFGAEMVKQILDRGDKVAATFRQSQQAEAFTNEYRENGLGIVLDVTEIRNIGAAIQKAMDRFQKIDVLVNNAGYGTIGAIEEFSLGEIRQQMETNFFGVVALTQAVLPIMRQQGSGHIVQMSSQAGFRAAAGFGVYNASKFALEGFSEALAQEVAPFGIKLTIVEPGPFKTEFLGTSMRPAKNKIDIYNNTPVAQTYEYMRQSNGQQEGDPVKAANAIIDYVYSGKSHLRLPLGKITLQNMRAKLKAVETDIAANEDIALSTVYR